MNYIALSIPIFFLMIGVEWFAARRRSLGVYRFGDTVTNLSCGIGQQALAILFKALLLAGYIYLYETHGFLTFRDGSALPWLLAFVGVDFLYYWWHRASHEVAFLWAVHVVHHQSEEYNLAVALRQAWFSGLTSWGFYAPLALFGIPPGVFVTVLSLSTLYQFWIHTRLVDRLGPFELAFNAPSHHRVHHGRNARYLDKNYGATLIVWDRLFGSFEDETEEVCYGVVEPFESFNPIWANFDYWAHLEAKSRRARGWRAKLRVWFGRPGFTPPGIDLEPPPGVAEQPKVRYVPEVPRALAPYLGAQFVPVVAATAWLMVSGNDELAPEAVAIGAWVVVSTLAWGALLERRPWAFALEVARLSAAALAAAAALAFASAPVGTCIALLAFVLLSLPWIVRLRPSESPRVEPRRGVV